MKRAAAILIGLLLLSLGFLVSVRADSTSAADIDLPKSYSPHGLAPVLEKLRASIVNVERENADLSRRLERITPADNTTDWLRSIATGNPRPLAPGWYVIDQPIKFYRKHGLRFEGPATGLMDPVGTARAWWADSPGTQCIVVFDVPEGVPAITLTGCESCRFEGINFCRTTPGPLVRDSNATGLNSGGHTFTDGSFYSRWRHPSALPDPLGGLAVTDDHSGHIGLQATGTNGCDNYTFRRWRFEHLGRAVDIDTPQTTRLAFFDSWWEHCDTMAWCKRSGNVLAVNCTRYNAGPIVLENCPDALTSVSWVGSWIDAAGSTVEKQGMAPLVDFSRNRTGRLTIIGGNGRRIWPLPDGVTSPPLVVDPEKELEVHALGAWSAGQKLTEGDQ